MIKFAAILACMIVVIQCIQDVKENPWWCLVAIGWVYNAFLIYFKLEEIK